MRVPDEQGRDHGNEYLLMCLPPRSPDDPGKN